MKELRRLVITLMTMALAGAGWAGAQQKQAKNTASPSRTTADRRASATAGPLTADGPVQGSGTPNVIPLWTSSGTIGNSAMSQSGSNVSVSGSVTATSFTGDGTNVTNVNAAKPGGSLPSAFALLGASNTFTADQTVNGNLTLSGSIDNALTLQGNLTDSSGDQGANVIGGFGGANGFPGNSVANGVLGATIAGGGGASFNGATTVGVRNTVSANWGTVGGGQNNTASGGSATVGGGASNTASGGGATVAGGELNVASNFNAVVPGGQNNVAAGPNSFAAGTAANRQP